MPKVSVIIPTYNLSNMVGETVDSVLRQTEPDLEVIVVDDGSTDNTGAVIEGIRDSRVKYFYKNNGGTPSAYNYGFARAKGRYVAFLDHDDLWPENYLQVMLSNLENENNAEFGAAYSPITVLYADGSKIKSFRMPRGKSGWLTVPLFRRGFIWNSAVVIRRLVLEDLRFDELLRLGCEDWDYSLRLSVRTRFLFVRDVEAIRREHKDNLSKKMSLSPVRILVLERFYFQLGGNKIVPSLVARYSISHACRKVAEAHRRQAGRSAAVALYKRAIGYWPLDLRLYPGLARALLLNKNNDPNPGWQMPGPLHTIQT